MNELNQFRGEIDTIDAQIAALFQQRMAVTDRVGRYKFQNGVAVRDEVRERELLAAKAALSDDPAMQEALTALFECILSLSRKQQERIMGE